MVRKTLRNSKSDELERLEHGKRLPYRSTSVKSSITVSRGLLIINQRHNSVVQLRPMAQIEASKPRKQPRSYFNSPVKRINYFRPTPQITLQGELTRPEGVSGYRLQSAGRAQKTAHSVE